MSQFKKLFEEAMKEIVEAGTDEDDIYMYLFTLLPLVSVTVSKFNEISEKIKDVRGVV